MRSSPMKRSILDRVISRAVCRSCVERVFVSSLVVGRWGKIGVARCKRVDTSPHICVPLINYVLLVQAWSREGPSTCRAFILLL